MYPALSSSVQRRSPRSRRAPACSCDGVIALVARRKSIPLLMLTGRRRSPLPVARARQLAMYLAHVVLGRTQAEIAAAFGRDRTTVSYACALIEDLRDNPHFDEEVTALERQIEALRDGEGLGHAA